MNPSNKCLNCGHGRKTHIRIWWKIFKDGKCEGRKGKCNCKEWVV